MVRTSSCSHAGSDVERRCQRIHEWANGLRRFSFPFEPADIPENGIYFLFEKGERAHGVDRIVRIGTHIGKRRLPIRLKDHFLRENKDGSIFRKNIGRALLNKEQDSFLEVWDRKPTPREFHNKKVHVEKVVSSYIRDKISFSALSIEGKGERKSLESKIISTISWCEKNCPSRSWLGRCSPEQKIQESGLWLVRELYKEPLSEEEMEKLVRTQP